MNERRQLINLAYRLLGSLADAEDVVQETYARWYAMSREQREAIDSPGGWSQKLASRICLDSLGSARVGRERYAGDWIPGPLPDQMEWSNERSGSTSGTPCQSSPFTPTSRRRPSGPTTSPPGARSMRSARRRVPRCGSFAGL